MNQNKTAGLAEEQDRLLYATRLVGTEKWQAQVLLTENGWAIGYTGRFRPKKEGPHRRVKLGYAMAIVKDEDSELLPLG